MKKIILVIFSALAIVSCQAQPVASQLAKESTLTVDVDDVIDYLNSTASAELLIDIKYEIIYYLDGAVPTWSWFVCGTGANL